MAPPKTGYYSTEIRIELEFGNVGFWGEGKTGVTGEKPLEQRGEPTTNSAHIWRRVRESISSHFGGRRVLSPLRHPCSLITLIATVKTSRVAIIWRTESALEDQFDKVLNIASVNKSVALLFCVQHRQLFLFSPFYRGFLCGGFYEYPLRCHCISRFPCTGWLFALISCYRSKSVTIAISDIIPHAPF